MVMAVSPPMRPATEGRVRFRVGIPEIGAVRAAGITARAVFPIGIAAIDKANIRVAARWRIGQLVEIVSGPGKYRSLVDQIHFRRAGLCDRDHAAAAVRPAATPASVCFRHQSNGETCCDRQYGAFCTSFAGLSRTHKARPERSYCSCKLLAGFYGGAEIIR